MSGGKHAASGLPSELDLPIVLRKEKRSSTLHLISSFIYDFSLSPSYRAIRDEVLWLLTRKHRTPVKRLAQAQERDESESSLVYKRRRREGRRLIPD